jgi:hypothetical protein
MISSYNINNGQCPQSVLNISLSDSRLFYNREIAQDAFWMTFRYYAPEVRER